MNAQRLWTSLALVLAGLLVVAAAPPTSGPGAAPGPSYGVRPAHHDDSSRAGRAFEHALEVGVPVTDGVEIFNFTDEPATFDVYAADMVEAGDGVKAPAAREAEVDGPGAWVTPDLGRVEVTPGTSLVVPFTLEVPAGTLPGSYRAALLVEPVRPTDGQTIEARARVALPIGFEVLGVVDLGVDLGRLGWSRDDGAIRFELSVTNAGNATFVADGEVVVEGRGGRPPETRLMMTPAGRTLAPEAATTLTARWEEPPWFGRVTARPTVVARVGDRTPVETLGDPVTFWIVPWAQLLGGAIVTTGLVIVLLTTRDRRRRWRARRREERALIRAFRAQRRSPPGSTSERTDELPVG